MTTGQKVPAGYYVSNSKDEDCFFVDPKGNYYFKKEIGLKWSRTDKWNFDHICDVTTVNEEQGVSGDVDTHDGRGLEVKVSAHVGVTASSVMQWTYVNPDGNQAKVWAGPTGGVGDGVSLDAGVWYDKNGDLHMKLSTSGVIPHMAFGTAITINPKTITDLEKPSADDKAFAKGFTEGATLGIADKPPKILTEGVAVVSNMGKKITSWFK
tara:strand:+ start:2604 stop:3233 length:630 start_codon:yes stop_codon:yes gene_type:complete